MVNIQINGLYHKISYMILKLTIVRLRNLTLRQKQIDSTGKSRHDFSENVDSIIETYDQLRLIN